MVETTHGYEQQQLSRILERLKAQEKTLQEMNRYIGDDITEQALEDLRERGRGNLKIAKKEPYFARLDFQEELTNETEQLYIGKVGVADDAGDPLIIDWRAPIASLFYSFSGGDDLAYYTSPEGLVEGTVYLKRNIVIRNGKLQRVVDAYVKGQTEASNVDEFLLYRLSERESSKLQDIVSTIQSEQNTIIRAPKNSALFIQGVAGSGKTTIALHRLAYLIYQHQDKIRSERMIIFAPNRLFLDYIADVLPELGVGGIQQTTFNDWAMQQLDSALKLQQQEDQKTEWLEMGISETVKHEVRYKGSLQFMTNIKNALQVFDTQIIPDQSLELLPFDQLESTTIQQWYYNDYKHYPYSKRNERLQNRIKNWIEDTLKTYGDPKEKRSLKSKANQKLRTYMKKHLNQTPLSFYISFIQADDTMPEKQKKNSLGLLKKGEIQADDLPPLMMIQHHFYGSAKENKFHHVVIDEAQDFSPFQVAVIKETALNQSFTILGDLSQGIHEYQGIDHWEELSAVFDSDRVVTFTLEKSYRSTTEIIQFANKVLTHNYQPICLAEPVFRSGAEVAVIKSQTEDYLQSLTHAIQKAQEKGYQNIGVLTRTQTDSLNLQKQLLEHGIECQTLTGHEETYNGGLSLIPVYLSKGLEFEAAIIARVNEGDYPGDAFHSKLLYVGCTRALHELTVLYTDTLSPLVDL